ncbi:hypothetical protein ACN47E_006121 [Coniothyrium glycines]
MIARTWARLRGGPSHDYTALPVNEKAPVQSSPQSRARLRHVGYVLLLAVAVLSLNTYRVAASPILATRPSCDTVNHGYRCSPNISHFWGQYSLWFAVPSDIDVAPPHGCEVTFANVLSRHGGRDPTLSKSMAYHALTAYIQSTATSYPGKYSFLQNYTFNLGADLLTDVGRQEMVNSGAHFSRRYGALLNKHIPFVRSGGQDRVVESAQKWLTGVAQSLNQTAREVDLIIPEGSTYNNTLSHDTCPAFESGPSHGLGDRAQQVWLSEFVPAIQKRINTALGVNISATSTIYLMDMCPFDTLADPSAKVSRFCHLFDENEWQAYDYYQTLGKFYGYSVGNPLGATQGAGYVNELIARLTETPVQDNTNTNRTLDASPATFPLDRKVYADFSHDNDISGVLAALGLYNNTAPLSNTTVESTKQTHGYSAAWTVPFAARLYVEKLQCKDAYEESVRIIVNDRVQPLEFCGGDKHGRCTLSNFIRSQNFSRDNGLWKRCHE